MKQGGWFLAMLLSLTLVPAGAALTQQDQQQGRQQQDQQQQEQKQEQQEPPPQRPTLGPAPAPTLRGPKSSTTNDIRKLLRIRTLYVERIDNSLSDRLIEDLTKRGRFRLVPKPKEADATMRGSCLESRRLKRVHSEVFISDRNGTSIWQDTVYRPYNPPALPQAVDESAQLVVDHLADSIREAEQK